MLSSRDLSRSTRGIAEIAIDWNPDPTGAVPQKYQLIHPPVDTRKAVGIAKSCAHHNTLCCFSFISSPAPSPCPACWSFERAVYNRRTNVGS